MTAAATVFLLDVDNTLLDNDAIIEQMKRTLTKHVGARQEKRYWEIFEETRAALGYADYLGTLQRYRVEEPHDPDLLAYSSFLVNYPFHERLFDGALDVVAHLDRLGTPAIFTDGDVVFQPLKVERSGLFDAVNGRVMVYVHKEKELAEVEQLYPADHYVLIDDKVRILTAVKEIWGDRCTTVFPRQGHYAYDANVKDYPRPDITVERISDVLRLEVSRLIPR
jgi:FMN phosphatase YigB (HAD superfamily)